MTYCVGILLDEGMIFASDSRTNAGMDSVAKFCKMTIFERRGDRVIVLLSSGNLAGTQAVISILNQRCADGDAPTSNILGARTMFDVLVLVTDAMRETEKRDAGHVEAFNASFIVGGQIRGEPMRLFGPMPRATSSEPGRTPSSSRPARPSTASPSSTASSPGRHRWPMRPNVFSYLLIRRCAAIYQSACRSICCVTKGQLRGAPPAASGCRRPYFTALNRNWSEGLREVFHELPELSW